MPRPANPRVAFRQRQGRRIQDAATLAAKFPRLKSLKVEIEYYAADNAARIGHIKYVLNVEHAKSLFCFECPNRECIRGDFDLSDVLAEAVAARRESVAGEMRCRGWRNQDAVKKVYCRTILRYRLRLKYWTKRR
jgi:hypothetical protein